MDYHTIHIMYLFLILSIFRYMLSTGRLTSDVVYQPFPEIPRRAFTDPDSYFHNYAKLTKEEALILP